MVLLKLLTVVPVSLGARVSLPVSDTERLSSDDYCQGENTFSTFNCPISFYELLTKLDNTVFLSCAPFQRCGSYTVLLCNTECICLVSLRAIDTTVFFCLLLDMTYNTYTVREEPSLFAANRHPCHLYQKFPQVAISSFCNMPVVLNSPGIIQAGYKPDVIAYLRPLAEAAAVPEIRRERVRHYWISPGIVCSTFMSSSSFTSRYIPTSISLIRCSCSSKYCNIHCASPIQCPTAL